MKYITGEEIECGDQVIDRSFGLPFNDCSIGTIIVYIEKQQFHSDYPKEVWKDDERGFIVRYIKHGDIFYSTLDETPYPDLMIVKKVN